LNTTGMLRQQTTRQNVSDCLGSREEREELRNPCVDVAMLGARMHYAVPRLLYQAGLLRTFYTDNYVGNKPWLESLVRCVPASFRTKRLAALLGRKDPIIPPALVRSFEFFGLWYGWRLSRLRDKNKLVKAVAERAGAFDRKIIDSVSGRPRIIWGFSGAALELFEWARSRGIRCILEQMIAPRAVEVELLTEELERWPDWEPQLSQLPTNDARNERERAEWELADRIVGASQFVIDGLHHCGVALERCRLAPYGIAPDLYRPKVPYENSEVEHTALRVLFVGEVGLRKGAPYLLEALSMFPPGAIDARLVGTVAMNHRIVERFSRFAKFVGVVPRSEMPKLYTWADVLCLPSICEGSATATYEALASEVPVIATPNAGSVIQDGFNGFLVPIRDPEAIADRLRRYQLDRLLLRRHRTNVASIRDDISLQAYGERIVSVVSELIKYREPSCSA